MTVNDQAQTHEQPERGSDALRTHLATLVDALPERDQPSPFDAMLETAAHIVVTAVADHPHIAYEQQLQSTSPLDSLRWALASRLAIHRGWLLRLPSHTGKALLIPTPEGRSTMGPNIKPTRMEALTERYGQHAELIASLQDHIAPNVERWIVTTGALDLVAVVSGRGVAALAVNPSRPAPTWTTVFDHASAVGATTLLLAAWPEERVSLANSQHAAHAQLTRHPARLTLSIKTEILESASRPGTPCGC